MHKLYERSQVRSCAVEGAGSTSRPLPKTEQEICREIEHLHSCFSCDDEAQIKLDSYLLVSAVIHRRIDIGFSYEKLILNIQDSPQFNNLPDLGVVLRECLIYQRWNQNFLCYCLHRCFPSPKASVKIVAPDTRSCVILFNVLLATLLGLYPSNIKRPPFQVRSHFFARVHALLTCPSSQQIQFACDNIDLLVFCLSEYVCCVVPCFFVAEYESICEVAKVNCFFQNGQALFDCFRQENLDSGLETFSSLDSAAKPLLEKICRMYRSKCASAFQNKTRVPKDVTSDMFLKAVQSPIIKMYPCHEKNPGLLAEEYAILLEIPPSVDVAGVHSSVSVSKLPYSIYSAQVSSILQILFKFFNTFFVYQFERIKQQSEICEIQAQNQCLSQICLMCEWRLRKPVLRLCSSTFKIVCQNCEGDQFFVSAINLLGRILKVRGRQYFLSLCCGTIQEYRGSGSEFDPASAVCAQCVSKKSHHMSNKMERKKNRPLCSAWNCCTKALPVPHVIVDHIDASLETVFLCFKHTPPESWIKQCKNFEQFSSMCQTWDAKLKSSRKK